MYGDRLFDVAYLIFHTSDTSWLKLYRSSLAKDDMDNVEKRIRCYVAYTALDALGFYAKVERQDDYQWAKNNVLELLEILK